MTLYLIIFLHYLIQSPKITLISCVLFLMAFFTLCGILFILILDKVYRPNVPQYSFNNFFDHIIPKVTLITPIFIILILQPFNSWFARLILLLVIHIFLLIPLFHYWSQLRSWYSSTDQHLFNSWIHPRVYKHISLAIIYPLLWGLYFSLARFLRLGSSYDVFSFFSPDYLVFLFLAPHLILWLLIPLNYISKIRNYLWNQLSVLLYSIHIYLLQYNIYFKCMRFIYKTAFVCFHLITLNIKNKHEITWFTKLINYLYYHPRWFQIIIFLFVLLEILYTKQLYYSIYILFIYPLIHSFLLCFFSYYHNTDFVFDCCFSDYCVTEDSFSNLRYPLNFWFYFDDAYYYFGHEYDFTTEQLDKIQKEREKPKAKWLLRKNLSFNLHQDLLNIRILRRHNSSFCLRLKANYLHSQRVRWVHTERILNNIYKYHSCTALFAKTIYDKIVLLNNSWSNIDHIHAAQKYNPISQNIPDLYKPFKQTFSYKKSTFIGIQEENIPSNFADLIDKGVNVEPYDENNVKHLPVFKPQPQPDTIFIFKGSTFIDQRGHAMDQKTNDPGLGHNKLLSQISEKRFHSTIDRFEKELQKRRQLSPEISLVLAKLKATCNDFNQHQMVWALNAHLFPDNFIPPLKIPQNFSYSQLKPSVLDKIKIAENRMKLVSEYLFLKKVPKIHHGLFYKQALDHFEDSYIQKVMQEHDI